MYSELRLYSKDSQTIQKKYVAKALIQLSLHSHDVVQNCDYDGILVFVVLDGLKLAFKCTEVMSVYLCFLFVLLLNDRVNIVWLCVSYLTA